MAKDNVSLNISTQGAEEAIAQIKELKRRLDSVFVLHFTPDLPDYSDIEVDGETYSYVS